MKKMDQVLNAVKDLAGTILAEILEALKAKDFPIDETLSAMEEGEEEIGRLTRPEMALSHLSNQKVDQHNQLATELQAKFKDFAQREGTLKERCNHDCGNCDHPEVIAFRESMKSEVQKLEQLAEDQKWLNRLMWMLIRRRLPAANQAESIGLRKGCKIVKCKPEEEHRIIVVGGPGLPGGLGDLLRHLVE